MRRAVWVLFACVLATRPALADDHADVLSPGTESNVRVPDPPPPISKLRRTGAVLAAIGPGLFVRGTGSYLVREKRTAKHLLEVAAIGAGMLAVSAGPVGITGGNPYTMPLMPVLIAGGGLFFTSWWSDIATAAGVSSAGRARALPPWSIDLDTIWLHDPYRQAGLVRLGGRVWVGRVGLGGEGLIDAENEIRDGAGDVRVRLLGASATDGVIGGATDGSFLHVRAGLRVHHDDGDRITIATGEAEAIGRLDLQRVDAVLAGTFSEISVGGGLERVTYTGAHDHTSLLLGRFAWGAYLGGRGEAKLWYDHRRDGMVGGLAAWRAAGFVGSFGTSFDWILDRRWGVHGELDVGNAWVTTVGVRLRGGGQP